MSRRWNWNGRNGGSRRGRDRIGRGDAEPCELGDERKGGEQTFLSFSPLVLLSFSTRGGGGLGFEAAVQAKREGKGKEETELRHPQYLFTK